MVTSVGPGSSTISYKAGDCGGVSTTTLTVNALPLISTVSNSPVCAGGTLNLSSNGGVSYIWTGPNGFNSTTQNPSLSNIVAAAAGTYSVKGTNANGCSNTATVLVTVNTLDSDGDGIPDACDDDADNDGIPNVLECNKSNFFWSNPPTVSGKTATGTINGIGYTYTSSSPVTTTTNMYGIGNFPSSYGVPNANPTIQNTQITNNTITFASPMTNPVFVFASIGQGGLRVPISFSVPIQVVWSQNVTINSSTKITGEEGYAIVRIMGTYTSISFNYEVAENYCNFAFGADFQSCPDTDGDGIPDYLDTDSDNDGCPDAIEGSMGFSLSQTSNGRLTGGVDSRGIPLIAGNGQGIGTSKNYVINCFCQPTIDKTSPTVITKNILVYLDASGKASITADQIDNGSSDNCEIKTRTVSPNTFTCDNVSISTRTQTLISDINWAESETTYSTGDYCVSHIWNGVSSPMPTLNSYNKVPTINKYSITLIPGTEGLFGLNGVRFFRKTFELSSLSGIKATLLAAMDNGVQIFINGVAVAYQGNMFSDGANFNGLNPDRVILNSTGANVNGGVGYHSFDNITNANAANLFVVGTNEIVLALANCDGDDRGAISFKAIIENNISGPNPVVLTVTDVNGNSASATAQVTVVDNIKPVISCANNKEVYATSAAGAVVTYDMPVATDNCSIASITMISGGASGSTFNIGTTMVTYRATDPSGNFTDCSFTVTVKGLLPVINCPVDIRVPNTPDACGAKVSFAATETIGIPASTITYSIQPGTFFPVGTTPVTATATNAVGTSTCSFTITVVDTQFPVLIGVPSDVTVECDALPAPAIVTASDNCSTSVPTFTETRTNGNCANNYTLTRTWSTTDASKNTTTQSQVITVQDTKAPVLSEAPGDVTIECNAVPDAAVLTASDNCDASPVVTYKEIRTDGNCPSNYLLTRTWTAKDACGNTSSKTQVIKVQDTQPPVLSTAPADVTAECNAVPAAAVLTATDNCDASPVVTYKEVRTDGNCPGNYTLTRTWTAKDACGNISSKTQVIKVQDTQAPVLSTAPADVTTECNAVPSAAVLTATDNCSIPVVAYVETSTQNPDIYSVSHYNYTLTRTWTATDACSNASSKKQVITVQDKTNPLVTCPVVAPTCNDLAGNTKTITLVASDNCSPLMITYALSGATIVNGGSGAVVTQNFNVGTTVITWIVKDISGNTSSCTTTVVVNPLPVASITSSNADAFCNKLTLTGNSTLSGPFSYQWLYAGGSFMSTQVVNLGLTNGDGVYSLYTTDGNGCRSELAASYTYQKQNLINSYTLLGFKGIKLGKSNTVQSGSAGVSSVKGKAEIGKGVSIASPGAFLKAIKIDIDGTVNIPTKIYAAATTVLPTMIYNTSSTAGLPDYKMKTVATVTLTGNYNNVYIKKGSNVTLTGNVFGNIKIERGAQVSFTSAVVNVNSLSAGSEGDDGQEGNYNGQNPPTPAPYTTVKFGGNTQVLVKNKVDIARHTLVNPNNYKVTFYVGSKKQPEQKDNEDKNEKNGQNNQQGYEGQDQDDESAFTVSGSDAKVISNVYIPSGKLMVNGNDNDYQGEQKGQNENTVTTHPTYMTGLFIANRISSESRGVIWNSYDCSSAVVAVSSSNQAVAQSVGQEKATVSTTEEELKVTVMPNPSNTYFTLKLESRYETPVNMRVMDAQGRVVDAKSKIGSNSTLQIGQGYSSGTYYAEMIQGTRRKVVQLIKEK